VAPSHLSDRCDHRDRISWRGRAGQSNERLHVVAVGGGSIGLLVGGILTQAVNWHWIFVINVPIGALTILLGSILIKETRASASLRPRHRWFAHDDRVAGVGDLHDRQSVELRMGLGPHVCYRCTRAFSHGSLRDLRVTPRQAHPAVHILKIRSLTTSSIVRGLSFSSMFSVFFFGALYLEKVLGYAPLRTGLAFLPMTLIMAFMSLGLTSRLLMRYGPFDYSSREPSPSLWDCCCLRVRGSTRITCSRCSHLSSSSGPA